MYDQPFPITPSIVDRAVLSALDTQLNINSHLDLPEYSVCFALVDLLCVGRHLLTNDTEGTSCILKKQSQSGRKIDTSIIIIILYMLIKFMHVGALGQNQMWMPHKVM